MAGAALAACGGAQAQEPFVSEMRAFAFNYCPKNWVPAAGQTLAIAPNQALYALMGINYGGNGTTNVQLPDMRGRAPLGQNPTHPRGQQGGQETTTLIAAQMPPHAHTLTATTVPASRSAPAAGDLLAQAQNAGLYVEGPANTALAMAPSGSNQEVPTRDPYLAVTWCVALQGSFPPSN
ncbi:microcystin-dependent protein [Acidovorax sp. MR-S7]|nr:microcystin-dependent protein [Acidovorax sp. MR-S7]